MDASVAASNEPQRPPAQLLHPAGDRRIRRGRRGLRCEVQVDTAVVVRVLREDHFDAAARSQPDIAIAIQEELLRRIGARLAAAPAMVRHLLE
jgi:hypothetical protein